MASKIVDLSALSELTRDEPLSVHFWECTPNEYQRFLWNPRAFLDQIGIHLPLKCRIETVIENHDWIGKRSDGLKPRTDTVICNIGGGDLTRSVYRIVCFGRDSKPAKIGKKPLSAVRGGHSGARNSRRRAKPKSRR